MPNGRRVLIGARGEPVRPGRLVYQRPTREQLRQGVAFLPVPYEETLAFVREAADDPQGVAFRKHWNLSRDPAVRLGFLRQSLMDDIMRLLGRTKLSVPPAAAAAVEAEIEALGAARDKVRDAPLEQLGEALREAIGLVEKAQSMREKRLGGGT